MKRALNITLFLSFIATIMAPVTGIYIHKPAATIFLLSVVTHMIMYRKKIRGKQWLVLGLILFSFLSGLFSLILEQFSILLKVHQLSAIALVFFLAIHVSVSYKKI